MKTSPVTELPKPIITNPFSDLPRLIRTSAVTDLPRPVGTSPVTDLPRPIRTSPVRLIRDMAKMVMPEKTVWLQNPNLLLRQFVNVMSTERETDSNRILKSVWNSGRLGRIGVLEKYFNLNFDWRQQFEHCDWLRIWLLTLKLIFKSFREFRTMLNMLRKWEWVWHLLYTK